MNGQERNLIALVDGEQERERPHEVGNGSLQNVSLATGFKHEAEIMLL